MSLDYFIPDAFFGNTELSQINASAHAVFLKEDVFTKTTRYFNYTGQVVTVIERSGIQHEFGSIPSYSRADFMIVTDWKIHKSLHLGLVNFLKVEKENETAVIRKLREVVLKYQPTIHEEFIFLRTEEKILLGDLEKHRKEIYVHDHDVVVSLYRGIEAGPHPYSPLGRALDMTTAMERDADSKAFCETIRIVDNLGTYGDRFINRNKSVYRIEAVRDATREDGVWVIRNKPFENTRLPSKVGWRRYTFEEADGILELYKTYAEAEHCGDAEYKRKQELLELETRLTREKTELAEQKLRHQSQQQEWDMDKARQLSQFERQQAAYAEEAFRARQELDRQKHFYERQMLDLRSSAERRKDVSDWLKHLPAIMGAVGVAWLSYKTAQFAANRASAP
jgi:hypothetical protein